MAITRATQAVQSATDTELAGLAEQSTSDPLFRQVAQEELDRRRSRHHGDIRRASVIAGLLFLALMALLLVYGMVG